MDVSWPESFDQQLSLNQEVIGKIPEREPLNYIGAAVRLLPLLHCAARSVPQRTLTWAFNPSTALTGSPPPVLLPSGLRLPPLQTPTVSSKQPSSLASLLGIILNPHLHNYTGIFSQMPSFFLSFFSGAAPCRSAPPLLSFLLEVSTMTNSRLAGVCSAPVPGVMGAGRPLPLAIL